MINKIVITNQKALNIYDMLVMVSENIANFSFNYARKRNMDKLQECVNKARSLRIPDMSSKRKEYEEQRMDIAKQYATEDEKGNPVVINGMYDIPDASKPLFEADINDLLEKYPDVKEQNEIAKNRFESWLKEEFEFERYLVQPENVPNLPGDLYDIIEPVMIDISKMPC